jgi:L-asparaginase
MVAKRSTHKPSTHKSSTHKRLAHKLSVDKAPIGKTILILNAGGTIGMVAGRSGLVPSRRFTGQIGEWLGRREELRRHQYVIDAVEPLIDSANAEPSTWHDIARRIWRKREQIDGVVVLHGTDTLAYTAGALSFLLINFGKPIVLTGAQVPFSQAGSDGEANVRGALACAAEARIREVCVYFDGRLLRGNRARKWSTQSGEGFFSPHWPELGQLDDKLRLAASALLQIAPSAEPAKPAKARPTSVGLLKLYPGISERIISAAGDAHPDGLVLELYGSGTGPAKSKAIRAALQAITSRRTPVVGVSQCVRGRVTPDTYAASRAFAECGVANGYDLTPEAALTKLSYLRNSPFPLDRIGSEMARPLAGELTADPATEIS